MTIQEHSDDGDSSALFPGGNGTLLDDGGLTTTDGGYVPKIRKPYTITKQRERWTDEEHMKFIEALKLYGRAWRKIEDHVGTKTAVQIRSHAQKFFSKVVRETKSSQCSSTMPLEIPPPRPKKKPMHPYPRKLALPAKTDMFLQEQQATSTSPNSSTVDQEQQSPTSVLSAFVSETVGSADSGMLDGNSSPTSPTSPREMNKHDVYLMSEANPMVQENASQSDAPITSQLDLFPKYSFLIKEESTEATPTKSVKLFGKTLLLDNAAQAMEVGPSAPVPIRAFSGGMPFPFNNTKTQANASLKRSNSEQYTRAFVPYKRSLSENEMQRTRLCL